LAKVNTAFNTVFKLQNDVKCPEPLWKSDAEYLEGWWPNRKNVTSGEEVSSS